MIQNEGETIEIPFNWYDWVDMSVLEKYLIASNNENQIMNY